MSLPGNIPDHHKLTVLMRVEGGSLGPEGKSHLNAFCDFAQQQVSSSQCGHLWEFLPRTDKTAPEMSFKIGNKLLSSSQADQYLRKFDLDLESFSWDLADQVAILVEQYFNRAPS